MYGMVDKGGAFVKLGSIVAKWPPSGIFFLSRRLISPKFLLAHESERTVRFSGGIFSIIPQAFLPCLPHLYTPEQLPFANPLFFN